MKFLEMVEDLQKRENKIILVKCGIFFVAIGRDAVFLNKILNLNVICIKPGICKVGIPISNIFKYTDKLEKNGYGYVLYDYNSKNKQIEKKYIFEGNFNKKLEKNLGCRNCKNYQKQCQYENIYIFDILEERKKEQNNESKEG